MKRTEFTKAQIETVTNFIADGATDEQIITFATKNLKMTEETAAELILKINLMCLTATLKAKRIFMILRNYKTFKTLHKPFNLLTFQQ